MILRARFTGLRRMARPEPRRHRRPMRDSRQGLWARLSHEPKPNRFCPTHSFDPLRIASREEPMLNRRHVLISAAALLSSTRILRAADWRSQYPELTFAVVPAENASGVSDRYAGFTEYLSKELGVPVKLRVGNDYAAVIEGQRAGNIQIAFHGPASRRSPLSRRATMTARSATTP